MYKAIKDNKIIAISDTDSAFFCLVKDTVETDEMHIADDYAQYNGEYLLLSDIPPTHEEQEKRRERAYIIEVDGITAHIDRLKDEEQTPEIITKIETLKAERSRKVAAIKERFPYYDEE